MIQPVEQGELAHHVETSLPEAYGPRLVHLGEHLIPGADLFISSRSVMNLSEPAEPNVLPHTHLVSQTYVFTSPDGSLEVEVMIDDERLVATAPSTIFIPAGIEHSLRILRGTGTVLSIVRSGTYS